MADLGGVLFASTVFMFSYLHPPFLDLLLQVDATLDICSNLVKHLLRLLMGTRVVEWFPKITLSIEH